MYRILTANAISLMASVFLCLGGLARSKRGIYFCQFLECVFLIISQIVFWQLAGAVTMLFGAVRNYLASRGSLNKQISVFIFIAIGVLGIGMNTGGVIGLIPVAASLIITVTSYVLRDVVKIRLSVMFNLLLWVIYSFVILDIITGITNSVALFINTVTFIRELRFRSLSKAQQPQI